MVPSFCSLLHDLFISDLPPPITGVGSVMGLLPSWEYLSSFTACVFLSWEADMVLPPKEPLAPESRAVSHVSHPSFRSHQGL
jgi:hypothetical protein